MTDNSMCKTEKTETKCRDAREEEREPCGYILRNLLCIVITNICHTSSMQKNMFRVLCISILLCILGIFKHTVIILCLLLLYMLLYFR